MLNSLIEQVRRMAKRPDLHVCELDVVALLAYMTYLARVEEAAIECDRDLKMFGKVTTLGRTVLDAALATEPKESNANPK